MAAFVAKSSSSISFDDKDSKKFPIFFICLLTLFFDDIYSSKESDKS